MRQVFTSARLENVEHVAKLLEDAGIEVRITNGRSYKGAIRGNFTYRDDARGQMPAVWIVQSEDQPQRARDAARGRVDGFLAQRAGQLPGDEFPRHQSRPGRRNDAQRRAFRIKLGLLVVIAAIVALAFMTMRGPSTPVPAGMRSRRPSPRAAIPGDLPVAAPRHARFTGGGGAARRTAEARRRHRLPRGRWP